MNHYCADGPQIITTVQTQAPNESLLCRLGPQLITTVQTRAQMNHYCADSGPNESYSADSGPKLITTGRFGPQMNHYCADSGPNESLLCRLNSVQMKMSDRAPKLINGQIRPQNHYCADSGFQWITTVQIRVSKEVLLLRLRLQISLAQDGSVISGTFWFQLSTMEANRDMSSIFFYSLRNTVRIFF